MKHHAEPLALTQSDRAQVWKYLQAHSLDRDYVSVLVDMLNEPATWEYDRRSRPQLDYSPAVALYLRDCWASGNAHQFADEMRAMSVCAWHLACLASAGADAKQMLIFVLDLLCQQSERLKICWHLSQPEYRTLVVHREIVDAILITSRKVRVTGFNALNFNAWLTKEWLPQHFRYYLFEQAEQQFGPLEE